MDIIYNQQRDYLHVVTTGIVDADAVAEIAGRISGAVEEYHCIRVLNDMRKSELKLETVSIYNTPKLVQHMGLSKARRAIVYSENQTDFNFIETVSKNRGQTLKVFTDINEARQWLLS